MANEIYQAFVNAGFKNEAIKLSETVRTKDGLKIRPALGHYIAILDDYRKLLIKGKLDFRQERDDYKTLLSNARIFIRLFMSDQVEKINKKAGCDLVTLFHPLEHEMQTHNVIEKFTHHFDKGENLK